MNVSLVVVTWRSERDLRRLVASLRRHLGAAIELVVVDNASGDGVEAEARGWPGPTRFIELETNLGYGAAANRGVEAAAGEAVVLLNPDTELVDSSLPALARFALERGVLAGPRLLDGKRRAQPSASGPPVGAWPWIGALVPGVLQPRPFKRRTEPWRLEGTARVSWLTGACVAAPRELLADLGPFDPAIHLYGEDMDLGLRAGRAGVHSYLCPELARVVHHGRGSTSQLLPEGPWELIARNRRAVIRRAHGERAERAAHAALVVNLGLRSLAKQALNRDSRRERLAMQAALQARRVPDLPPAPASAPRAA